MKRNLLRLFILSVMSIFALGASALRGGADKDYLCFTANTENSTVELNKKGSPTAVTIEYSTNGTDWTSVDFSSATTTGAITLNNVGDKVYFRNAKTAEYVKGFSLKSSCYLFAMTGSIAASGNVMSLIDKDCTTTTIPCGYCFYYLFRDCKSLTSAPELPATTLADNCYYYMFNGCTSLASAPKLPATTLADFCYYHMFNGCTSLASAPELPATTLADNCYDHMFYECTALASAPELPATTLADNCYYYMFYKCSGLASAPELPATTLAGRCYAYMFNGCTSLNDIKVGFTDWGSTSSTTSWVTKVASSGTFACPSTLDMSTTGSGKIPSGWTTVTNNYDLTITDAGWASMCVNLPLTIPTGAEVYYASAVSGSQITLTQIEAGTTIAARTAVLVKGAKGTVSFPIANEAGTSYTDNLFAGTSVDKPKTEDVYVLSGVGTTGNPQFQNYTGTTLGAHKIWLPASAVGGSNAKELRFVLDNEEVSAIHNAEFIMQNSNEAYNLNGMRVGKDYKGIVIVNGKKVIK